MDGVRGSLEVIADGVKVFEPSKVANIFNRFYTTVAANLVNALPSASGLYSIANSTYRHLRFSRRNYCDTLLCLLSLVNL